MPYPNGALPAAAQALPERARDIFMGAFNAAWAEYADAGAAREQKCLAVAWAAVKRSYKETAGQWAAKDDAELVEELWREADDFAFVAQDSGSLALLIALAEDGATGAGGERASTVEVARTGVFVDAHGKNVEITETSLDAMVRNFEAQVAGQDVPIDVMHEKREAGGWVRRVWREGAKLKAEVAWNGLGQRLVGDRVYRYLSASIAMPSWVLRSISLVNFPAIKGLQPVELSEYLLGDPRGPQRAGHSAPDDGASHTGGNPMPEDEKQAQTPSPGGSSGGGETKQQLADFAAALEAGKAQIITDMMEKITAELAQKREEMLAQLADQMADERALSEFVLEATAQGAHALPVKADELTAALRDLSKPQRTRWMSLLKQIAQSGTVDMGEIGTAAAREDGKRKLEPEIARILSGWKQTGKTVEAFFAANPELGAAADYDLSEVK